MSSLMRISPGSRDWFGVCRVCSWHSSLRRVFARGGEPYEAARIAKNSLWRTLASHIRREHPAEIEAAEAKAAKQAARTKRVRPKASK